jgi:steroid delta-isomerase-like uncharacterized protein
MSTEDNKRIARQFNDAFDHGDLAACEQLLAPHFQAYQPGVAQPLNVEAFRHMGQMFIGSFSNSQHEYAEQIAEGEQVATRAIWTAVHDRAPFQGIPAMGRKLNLEVVTIQRIVGGLIVEHRSIFDAMTLMQQLGAFPEPSAA